ncbi:MAG TPA: LacI family DNA-binding transcriptional regulator [Granulicella sp.]|jgi:LacI family transcriptional regulator
MSSAANANSPDKIVTLRTLAAHLDLDPATISVVLNDVPGRCIPDSTRERVKAAARAFGYSPNLLARSLRTRKTRTIGVVLPDVVDTYHAQIVSGISNHLARVDYFCAVLPHGYNPSLVPMHIDRLIKRGVEGLIVIDTELDQASLVPTVAVGCSGYTAGTTVIELDHGRAAALALECILRHGHQRFLLIGNDGCNVHGSKLSNAVRQVAASFGLEVRVGQTRMIGGQCQIIEGADDLFSHRSSSLDGVKAIVALGADAATLAIRSFSGGGVCAARDVLVVCIDSEGKSVADSTTTVIRQPLRNTGQLAAEILFHKLNANFSVPQLITIEPEMVARTMFAPSGPKAQGS